MGERKIVTDADVEAYVERFANPRPPVKSGSDGRGAFLELFAACCPREDPFVDSFEKGRERRRAAEAAHPPSPVKVLMKDGVWLRPEPPPPPAVDKAAVARAAAWTRRKIVEGCCRRCGKERGKDGSDVYCRGCADRENQKMRDRRKGWTPEDKARVNEVNKARRQRLIAEGRCRKCAKPRDTGLAALCGPCSVKAKELNKLHRERRKARTA